MPNESILTILHPLLHRKAQDKKKLDAALLQSVADKIAESRDTNARFFAEQGEALVAAARTIAGVYRGGGRRIVNMLVGEQLPRIC